VIVKEYTENGEGVQAELCWDFMEMVSRAGADMWQFLSDLQICREEIIACGINIDDNNY